MIASPVAIDAGNAALMTALQVASVVTSVAPRNLSPSPKPDVSHVALAKNSTRYVVLAVEFNAPRTVVLPPLEVAEVSTG